MLAYTRQEAIKDGVFTDVSKFAREADITTPVAITPGIRQLIFEDSRAVERGEKEKNLLSFLFKVIQRESRKKPKPKEVNLSTLVFVPGDVPPKLCYEDLIIYWDKDDKGKPAITIMLSWER